MFPRSILLSDNGNAVSYYHIHFGMGSAAIANKLANNYLAPPMVIISGTCIYLLLLLIGFLFVKIDTTINAPGIFWSIIGALLTCAGTLGYFYALKNGGAAGQTAILTGLYPSLTLVLSMIFLHERISIKQSFGIVLALISFF